MTALSSSQDGHWESTTSRARARCADVARSSTRRTRGGWQVRRLLRGPFAGFAESRTAKRRGTAGTFVAVGGSGFPGATELLVSGQPVRFQPFVDGRQEPNGGVRETTMASRRCRTSVREPR